MTEIYLHFRCAHYRFSGNAGELKAAAANEQAEYAEKLRRKDKETQRLKKRFFARIRC